MKTWQRIGVGAAAAAAAYGLWRWRTEAAADDGDGDDAFDAVAFDALITTPGYESNAQREARQARDAQVPRPPAVATSPSVAEAYSPPPPAGTVRPYANDLDHMLRDASYRQQVWDACYYDAAHGQMPSRWCRLWQCYSGVGGCAEFEA